VTGDVDLNPAVLKTRIDALHSEVMEHKTKIDSLQKFQHYVTSAIALVSFVIGAVSKPIMAIFQSR